MPIFFQKELNEYTRLGIWKIEEDEDFFLRTVPLQRSITHPHKRLQHLAGRYLLKLLFPRFPVELIEIADTRKPFLVNEAYHFSISHCGDYAAAIVSTSERVGIDIEIPGPTVEKIAHKFLHPEEQELLTNSSGDIFNRKLKPQEALTLFWSGKEAMFKWWGLGNVDFSEMLRIYGNFADGEGFIEACLVLGKERFPLTISHINFKGLVGAWIHTAP
jgi:phosphopantetheinyl transferase